LPTFEVLSIFEASGGLANTTTKFNHLFQISVNYLEQLNLKDWWARKVVKDLSPLPGFSMSG